VKRGRQTMVAEDRQALGDRMRQLIRKAGKTQREVAEEMGIPEATLSRYVRGDREPSGPYVRLFTNAVGCSTDALYRGDDEMLTTEVMDLFLKASKLVMAGENVGEGLEKASGVMLTEEEFRMLSEQTANIRHILNQESGGKWDLLRDEEKKEILERIAQMAEDHN
jgi:transcriptional regulator with XRE-family HTH domain